MMIQKITREEEAKLPRFESHAEARDYFKIKYGDAFMLASSEVIGDGICYFYCLILDWPTFEEEQKKLHEGRIGDALALLRSYQNIQIMDTGEVHIVH